MKNSCDCTQADFDIAVLDGLSYIAGRKGAGVLGVFGFYWSVYLEFVLCALCLLLALCVRHDAWCCIVCAQSCMQFAGLVSREHSARSSGKGLRAAQPRAIIARRFRKKGAGAQIVRGGGCCGLVWRSDPEWGGYGGWVDGFLWSDGETSWAK